MQLFSGYQLVVRWSEKLPLWLSYAISKIHNRTQHFLVLLSLQVVNIIQVYMVYMVYMVSIAFSHKLSGWGQGEVCVYSCIPVYTIFWVGTKTGLWTLDWAMDWTMDWIMDLILELIVL